MSEKIRVGIVFGGKSAEHEVSLQSAKSVLNALDRDKYEPILIGIDKDGSWQLAQEASFLLHADNPKLIALGNSNQDVALVPTQNEAQLIALSDRNAIHSLDVVFPVLHGPFGEDGTIQGLFKLANIPFVGPGVLGSAAAMDKDVAKRLLREANIPTSDFLVFHRLCGTRPDYKTVEKRLGIPCFVKPANLGSSVGISKVHNETEFHAAMADAFRYDHKVVVEEFIQGREIECAVLGNEEPIASIPGEIVPHHEFYSYEAKYLDEHGAGLEIPAKLSPEIAAQVQKIAVQSFQTLCCEGMARVDFFLRGENELFVNELNTIPGFTKISMYPKLWEASGIPYAELIDRLLELAQNRFKRESDLATSYS